MTRPNRAARFSRVRGFASRAVAATMLTALTAMLAPHAAGQVARRVPAEYPSIQAAINAAENGDEIVVAPGTYYAAIDFIGKAVYLHSSNGPRQTTIDASQLTDRSTVTCVLGERSDTILEGFTITGGSGAHGSFGGGMRIVDSAPTVRNCMFVGNQSRFGGGIYSHRSSSTVINCVFYSNNAAWVGGGMHNHDSSTTLVNCTFTFNSAMLGGAVASSDLSAVAISNCILWGNAAGTGGAELWIGEWYHEGPARATVAHSDLQGGQEGVLIHEHSTLNWTEGNIHADPRLLGLLFRPAPGSPCIDGGSNTWLASGGDIEGECRVMDGNADGTAVVDMGVDETWGAFADCNSNGLCDTQESGPDCNRNFRPDDCELADGTARDDFPPGGNGIPDDCERVRNATTGIAYATIQAAIDAALDGHEIIVLAGRYHEVLDFSGKAVHLHSADGPQVTIIDATGLNASVVRCTSGEGPDTILEGFTISGGTGTPGQPSYRTYGGGMYNQGSSPTVRDCVFNGNLARDGGAGMHNDHSSPTVTNCTFSANPGGYGVGGGMANWFESNPVVSHCIFAGNSAQLGAGVSNRFGSHATFRDCTFAANRADTYGAGMDNYESNPVVINCTFHGNSGCYGGAMSNYASSPSIVGCRFSGNTATGLFTGYGGAMYNVLGRPAVTNCTFAENSAYIGGAMYNYTTALRVANCVLWGNLPEELTTEGRPPLVVYTDIRGGHAGGGNIDSDPRFVRTPSPGPDGEWGTADDDRGDLRLQAGSPCVDAGTNAALRWGSDADGQCRVMNGDDDGSASVDMGAFERAGAVLDCNGDGFCDTQQPALPDCNQNFIPDACDLAGAWSQDCNGNATPDECDIAQGLTPDCNENGIPDACDIASGESLDAIPPGGDDIPDECEVVHNVTRGTYYRRIQEAIDASANGDELIAAPGTYFETVDLRGRSITLRSSGGPATTIIDAMGLAPAVQCRGGARPVLDGFTITGAGAGVLCLIPRQGYMSATAGVMIVGSSPTIVRCAFESNRGGPDESVGGGLFVWDGEPAVQDCTFHDNWPAAISCSGARLTIAGCTLEDNGAGISCPVAGGFPENCFWLDGAEVIADDCLIRNNQGVGIEAGPITVRRCTLMGNAQGIIAGYALVTESIVAGNAPYGGIDAYDLRIANSVIVGNASSFNGGGIRCLGASSIVGCTIAANCAAQGGGALAASGGYQANSTVAVTNTIIVGNSAAFGSQIALFDNIYGGTGALLVANYCNAPQEAEAHHVDPLSEFRWETGNIDEDAAFAQAPGPGPDGQCGTADDDLGDLRLTTGSPCIDAGDPGFAPAPGERDRAGRLRVWDGDGDRVRRVDLGAYEFGAPSPGDLNCDGRVNNFDVDPFVLALLEPDEYDAAYPNCGRLNADCNADGVVDNFDIEAFVMCLTHGGCP